MDRSRIRVCIALFLGIFLFLGTTGCQKDSSKLKPAKGYAPIKDSSLYGVTLKPLSTYQNQFEDAPAPVWSPSGNTFAYSVNVPNGIAELGALDPFHVNQIHLGTKRHIVALTDQYAIVASSSDQKDWLYPLKKNVLQLGKPNKWSASADAWQEWVVTKNGPGVLTGGYQTGTLSLTMENGNKVPLIGGEAYLSPDHHFGAVLSRIREKRVVNPRGGINMPSRTQPGSVKEPISLWNFDASEGPKPVTTIKLKGQELPKNIDNANIQGIAFSPNDQEIAILINSENGGSELTGQLDIFNALSGDLIGTTSYGNGFVWLSDSSFLWLNTPYPQGQGYDRIVNTSGNTLSRWEESVAEIVAPITNKQIIEVLDGRIGLANPDGSFTSFPGIKDLRLWSRANMSPGHKAMLVTLNKKMCLIQY